MKRIVLSVLGLAVALVWMGSSGLIAQNYGNQNNEDWFLIRSMDRKLDELDRKLGRIERELRVQQPIVKPDPQVYVRSNVDIACLEELVVWSDGVDDRLSHLETCRTAKVEGLQQAGCFESSRLSNPDCFEKVDKFGFTSSERASLMKACQSLVYVCR